ncbi:MAG: MogA/MoaB family molybdenum cofactor biosynthesis protein [Lachnospiraceae bacterium]
MRIAIITASTECYKGLREDASGPVIKRMTSQVGFETKFMKALPKDMEVLSTVMERLSDGKMVDLILTTGGVGCIATDCTPEATLKVVERLIPGIPEAMRAYSMRHTKRTMLTRAVAGIRKRTLIVNLPGSPKLVKECLEYILPELVHTVEVLHGEMEEADGR